MEHHFGEHLTIDGYGGDALLLNNQERIATFLKELPGSLGMTILMGPEVVLAPANGKKDPGGWSGFVIIAESHISIHTFPARGFISADVYTCHNGLDVDFVINYFKKTFRLQDIEKNFIQRGTRYPKENV